MNGKDWICVVGLVVVGVIASVLLTEARVNLHRQLSHPPTTAALSCGHFEVVVSRETGELMLSIDREVWE